MRRKTSRRSYAWAFKVIRLCTESDFDSIYETINDGAEAYRGVIPSEIWKEPFVSRDYLAAEIQNGVQFYAFEDHGQLLGVMGVQHFDDVVLIRHSYVRTKHQRKGIGAGLVKHHLTHSQKPVLVGCLKAMTWAISFYEQHGFSLVSEDLRDILRAKYWTLSSTHVKHSVVLADRRWFSMFHQ